MLLQSLLIIIRTSKQIFTQYNKYHSSYLIIAELFVLLIVIFRENISGMRNHFFSYIRREFWSGVGGGGGQIQ